MPELDFENIDFEKITSIVDEGEFQVWYKRWADKLDLHPDPDAPEQKYDYRAAFRSGAMPDSSGHWPSEFKHPDHPNRFVGGIDTITGEKQIDFEKMPLPIQFGDIDFEGTGVITLPEVSRKEPEPFLTKVKEWLKPSPEEITAEDIFTSFITKEQKEPPGLTHYKGTPVFTPEKEMEYARKYPNLMAARYALASLLPFGHLAASPTEEAAFKQLPENEQALRLTGELAAWAIMPPAISWLLKTGAKAVVGKFPWMAKPILNALKEATWFRRLTNKERGLVVETISDMKNAGLNDAQILKNLRNRNSTEYKSYFQEAVRKRTTGEVPPMPAEKPVVPPIKPEPPPVKKPKVETEIAKRFEEVIAAERKPAPLTILEAREVEIKQGQIDFEKVEALPEPEISPKDWEKQFKELAHRVIKAEKDAKLEPLTPSQQQLLEKINLAERKGWEEFSRARGYTKEEIEDYRKYLNLIDEGKKLGLQEKIASIQIDAMSDLKPEIPPRVAKPKAVKKAVPDNDIITWIKDTGGVREATLPGELKDLITDVDVKGKFKRAKGIPIGFLNKTTGRGFDEIVDEARSADFDVRDESHLIELIERTQRASMEGRPEDKVRPLTDETLTDKMWSDYIKEEMKDGVSEREATEALSRERQKRVTDEIAEEAEFARAEREAIQDEYRAVSEEVKPAPEVPKEIPEGWKIQEAAGNFDIYRPDGKIWGTRHTKEAAIKYAQVAAREGKEAAIDFEKAAKSRAEKWAKAELITKKPAKKPAERREFFGIRDKVDRGLMTAEEARTRKWKTEPVKVAESRLTANAADLAADYKAKGIERQASYSQFVKDRALKPEMDAKEFFKIYDRVTPKLITAQPSLIKEPAPFELKGEEPPPKLLGPQGKKAVFPEEKITPATKGKQEDFVKKQQKGDTIDLFSGFPLHKVDKAILEPLRNLYMKSIGDPLWNFLAETLPVEAGKRSRFVDAINKGLIWDYRKDPKFVDLRDDTNMRIQQYREKAKEIAEVMAKFSRAEQIRIAQIIKGGVTAAPKRYESAFEAIQRFQELQKDLQDLGILGPDNRFRQLTRKEIAAKFNEIKDFDAQIEKLRKRLQPIEKIGKVARSISEGVSEQIVSTSETEGLYEVKETKWTGLNEERIKEALTSRGFGEGEATQMISRVKESVVPLAGKPGTLKEIRTKVEKVVTKTIIQEIIKTRTYHPAMMARARGAIIKDINKLANKRDEILERIRLHYKMSGKLYLRRAYEKIENEKTFLKSLLNLLKIRKTRLKKGYEIKRKDLSPYYRETVLGEIKKAPYLVFKGLSEESHDVELMRMFMNISKNKDWAISPEEWTNIQALKSRHHLIPKYENFKPLPVTEKLGPLSGALVDPYIWDDLNQAILIRNEMIKAWDSMLSLWKVGKAVYNPATQCRNILSDAILADFAGLSPHRIDIYARTALDFYTKSGYWKEAKKNTPLMGTEWAAVEAMEFLKAASKLKGGNWLIESAQLAAKYLDMPGKIYQFWEQFFKLAIYTNERENGATIKAAYKHAEKFIFNYQKIPPAIRWAKRWWSPFITFSYKAIPRFAETVIRKPWKIAKYGLLMAAVEEITRRMLGESKEQMDREKRVLPDYMRKTVLPGQLSHLRVFYRDRYGRSKYLDLSFILPWGDIAEQWGQSYLVGRPFLPNHPFYVFTAEVAFNEIFFTGQELTDKELDEGSAYWKKLGTELWRQAMPSLAGSYGYNKFMAAYHGEKDWALRERSMTEAIFDVFFGLKIRSIDYNESHARRITQLKSKIGLAKQRFSKDYWKIVTNPTPDAEYDAKRQEKLYIRLNEDIDKIIGKITEIER